MLVKLLDPKTPEEAAYQLYKTAYAMTTCTMNEQTLDPTDIEKHTKLITSLIDNGHTSVLEHINYTFELEDISRALLQEISRHRHTSPTVQSTRWALKKMCATDENKDLSAFYYDPFTNLDEVSNEDIRKYHECVEAMLDLRQEFAQKYSNDIAKYLTPECVYTKEIMTLNARSLMNMMELRTSKRALKEFQQLMYNIYAVIPQSHKFIYQKWYEELKRILRE